MAAVYAARAAPRRSPAARTRSPARSACCCSPRRPRPAPRGSSSRGFALLLLLATYRWFTQWHVMVWAIIALVLLVPIGRYGLPITLPFQLEPYRALVAVVAIVWLLAAGRAPAVRRSRPACAAAAGHPGS